MHGGTFHRDAAKRRKKGRKAACILCGGKEMVPTAHAAGWLAAVADDGDHFTAIPTSIAGLW